LKLLQRQVAKQLDVNVASIVNWENNLSKPKVSHMPAIIHFLGYNPLPPSKGWTDRLVHVRTALGLSQRDAAARIGVDPCTLARWERGEREPNGAFATAAKLPDHYGKDVVARQSAYSIISAEISAAQVKAALDSQDSAPSIGNCGTRSSERYLLELYCFRRSPIACMMISARMPASRYPSS
jgi:transcriptional regulator with XRE-family HTH domain